MSRISEKGDSPQLLKYLDYTQNAFSEDFPANCSTLESSINCELLLFGVGRC
jgi:hypothetical protein